MYRKNISFLSLGLESSISQNITDFCRVRFFWVFFTKQITLPIKESEKEKLKTNYLKEVITLLLKYKSDCKIKHEKSKH